MGFLADLDFREVTAPGSGAGAARLYLGPGDSGLEVVVLEPKAELSVPALREIWKARHAGRRSPVVVAAVTGGTATLAGPVENEFWQALPSGVAERILRAALGEPGREAALRFLAAVLPDADSKTPGLRNEGLLATYWLRRLATEPAYQDRWQAGARNAAPVKSLPDRALLARMGFVVEALSGPASILKTAAGAQVSVAVFLDRSESPDLESARFTGASPVSYALHQAGAAGVPWVVVGQGRTLRLYSAKPDVGTAKRGRTETFAELNLDVLDDSLTAYLWLLFSPDALVPGGTLEQLLNDSRRYAQDLGTRLRERIYEEVIPRLADAVLTARKTRKNADRSELDLCYELALKVLFRLLFIAYGEDLDLLPYRLEAYQRRSLKTKVREVHSSLQAGKAAPSALWREVQLLFEAVDKGRQEWDVPKYNGGLFSADPEVSKAGHLLASLALPDREFSEAFDHLLWDKDPETGEEGPVDFRSLGVREFGTIYEGLLENQISIAAEDLTVDKEGRYRPAKAKDAVHVKEGAPFVGTFSGERKSTGSYYTKEFAVEHLLEHSLEPALKSHLNRVSQIHDEAKASESFFDFKVADIACGSGHFLIAACDRIERRFSDYLVHRPLPGVAKELESLRKAARAALGDSSAGKDLENNELLRRQIARRCLYGVDLNPQAVELARLAVWIHTFVPGLPLTTLDHNLAHGDSLLGIGSLDEARDAMGGESMALLVKQIFDPMLTEACKHLDRMAHLAEADARQVEQSRLELTKAEQALKPLAALCDILTASRVAADVKASLPQLFQRMDRLQPTLEKLKPQVTEALKGQRPFHFLLTFAEIFRRDPHGFDVVVGNPPWHETKPDENDFWSRWDAGYQGLPQRERESRRKKYRKNYPERVKLFDCERAQAETTQAFLTSGIYPGMGTGDPDAYKAFAWRFVRLLRRGGYLSVVLPRSVLAAAGSAEWREHVLNNMTVGDLTLLQNTGGWVFEQVHQQYTIALCSLELETPPADASIPLRGPYSSVERFQLGVRNSDGSLRPPVTLPLSVLKKAGDTLSLPLLPSDQSADIWLRMRMHPRLDFDDGKAWRSRPYRELDATNDKLRMDMKSRECPKGFWPVYKGESFDTWNQDTGTYYAWGDPERLCSYLHERRKSVWGDKKSPFTEFSRKWADDPATLPALHPRIAFRNVTRSTDTRTVRATLLPPRVFVTNAAPYLLWPRGDERDQAFLLGILSSIPLDWYARRHIEVNMNFFLVGCFPVPRPSRSEPLWRRAVVVAGRLAAQDKRLASWAKSVGVDCGKLPATEQDDLISELDALSARLYGLSEKQLLHVFETFHEGWDYSKRLADVLRYFRALPNGHD